MKKIILCVVAAASLASCNFKSTEQRYVNFCKQYDVSLKSHPGACECFGKNLSARLSAKEFGDFVDTMEKGIKNAQNNFGPAISANVMKAYMDSAITCTLPQ